MQRRWFTKVLGASALAVGLAACSTAPVGAPPAAAVDLKKQVADTERAFAKTMADRDLPGFVSFLADETVFFSGPTPLHGKQKVADFWRRFYEKPTAPFSWAPDQVEVLASGTLALSSGPVHSPDGKLISRFTSVWRLEAPGVWKIIFDKGDVVCNCEDKK